MQESTQRKEAPSVEQSMKYLAWDVKEINKSLKIIAMHLENMTKQPQAKQPMPTQGNLPF